MKFERFGSPAPIPLNCIQQEDWKVFMTRWASLHQEEMMKKKSML